MSKEVRTWFIVIIIANLFLAFCFWTRSCNRATTPINTIIHDTVTKVEYDTVTLTQWKPYKVTELREDTIYINDTLSFSIPISTYLYDTLVDSCCIAMRASGYELSIDSLSVQYPYRETIVTNTISVPQKRNWFKEHCRVGIGTGVGYGLIHQQFDVGVGIGFGLVL